MTLIDGGGGGGGTPINSQLPHRNMSFDEEIDGWIDGQNIPDNLYQPHWFQWIIEISRWIIIISKNKIRNSDSYHRHNLRDFPQVVVTILFLFFYRLAEVT